MTKLYDEHKIFRLADPGRWMAEKTTTITLKKGEMVSSPFGYVIFFM